MNKETMKLFNFMVENPKWINKLKTKRTLVSNYKDFFVETGIIITELLNEEKFFYDYPKTKIEIKKIVDLYF